ncbi:MAG TPA: ferritin-like domain-containing protein [Sporosarcina sp.]|mgnify:CR=1 FL=1|nr:ferritin-like domain-containing protein [Sporosarcina sp.]
MFIDQLKQAIEDEYKAYHYLQSMERFAKVPMWKSFIEHAYKDEKSHYEMFQQLYYMLTGTFVQNPKKELPCDDVSEGVKRMVYIKLEQIETYKIMLLTIPFQQAYQPIFIALLDEVEHAIRFSILLHQQ